MDSVRFKELFLPYHRRIYQVAFRLLGNSDDAEDMVQETYIKLWERREELSQVRNAEAFFNVSGKECGIPLHAVSVGSTCLPGNFRILRQQKWLLVVLKFNFLRQRHHIITRLLRLSRKGKQQQ